MVGGLGQFNSELIALIGPRWFSLTTFQWSSDRAFAHFFLLAYTFIHTIFHNNLESYWTWDVLILLLFQNTNYMFFHLLLTEYRWNNCSGCKKHCVATTCVNKFTKCAHAWQIVWLMAIVFKGLLSDIQFNTDIYNKENQNIDSWAKN